MAARTPIPESLRRHLTPDEINAMPLCRYEGPVHVVRNLEDWAGVLDDLKAAPVLGFDTETRPTFRKGKVNSPALVQLATENAVYLIQLAWLPFGPHLDEILADPAILKAGVGIRFDMISLARLSPFRPAGLVDLGSAARMNGLSSQGLRTLTADLFQLRISKGSQCSNWSLMELSARQIVYAATDAWIGRRIYLRMVELGFSMPPPAAFDPEDEKA